MTIRKIMSQIANQTINHADQTRESDASFLTRILSEYNAIATVKNGMLIIFQAPLKQLVSKRYLMS